MPDRARFVPESCPILWRMLPGNIADLGLSRTRNRVRFMPDLCPKIPDKGHSYTTQYSVYKCHKYYNRSKNLCQIYLNHWQSCKIRNGAKLFQIMIFTFFVAGVLQIVLLVMRMPQANIGWKACYGIPCVSPCNQVDAIVNSVRRFSFMIVIFLPSNLTVFSFTRSLATLEKVS